MNVTDGVFSEIAQAALQRAEAAQSHRLGASGRSVPDRVGDTQRQLEQAFPEEVSFVESVDLLGTRTVEGVTGYLAAYILDASSFFGNYATAELGDLIEALQEEGLQQIAGDLMARFLRATGLIAGGGIKELLRLAVHQLLRLARRKAALLLEAVVSQLATLLAEQMRRIDSALGTLLQAALLLNRAARLLQNAYDLSQADVPPEVYQQAQGHLDEAYEAINTARAAILGTAGTQQQRQAVGRAHLQTAASHVCGAAAVLQQQYPQLADRASQLITEAQRFIEEAAKAVTAVPGALKSLVQAYGEALFLAAIIRELPSTMPPGIQALEGAFMADELALLMDSIEAHREELGEIAESGRLDRLTATPIKAEQLVGLCEHLQSMESLENFEASAGQKYLALKEICERPFLVGDFDALLDELAAHTTAMAQAGSMQQLRADGLLRAQSVLRLNDRLIEILSNARREVSLIQSDLNALGHSAPAQQMASNLSMLFKQAGVPDPILDIATGSIAAVGFTLGVGETISDTATQEDQRVPLDTEQLEVGRRTHERVDIEPRILDEVERIGRLENREERLINHTIERALTNAPFIDYFVREVSKRRILQQTYGNPTEGVQ